MPCPPMPFVPESAHGTTVIMAMLTYVGPAASPERVLALVRALAEPLADMVRPLRYPEMYPPDDPDYHPLAVARTYFLDTFDEGTAKAALDRIDALTTSPLRVLQLRPLGGAAARVADDATAYAHRKRRYLANVAAFHEGPDDL